MTNLCVSKHNTKSSEAQDASVRADIVAHVFKMEPDAMIADSQKMRCWAVCLQVCVLIT